MNIEDLRTMDATERQRECSEAISALLEEYHCRLGARIVFHDQTSDTQVLVIAETEVEEA